jgi:hypothetical protein
MIKTIIFSLLIIIILNLILNYLKDAFTEPLIRYIDKPQVKEEMKNELTEFLSHLKSKEVNI